jgi:hypothetical protein
MVEEINQIRTNIGRLQNNGVRASAWGSPTGTTAASWLVGGDEVTADE